MSVVASQNEDADAEALRRAQRAHEPSMEEILASIRAIIADEREPASAPASAKPGPQIVYSSDAPPPPRPMPAPILAAPLAQAAPDPAPTPVKPEPGLAAGGPTVVWTREFEPAAAKPEPSAAPKPPPDEAPLVSEETEGAVAASFRYLSDSLTTQSLQVAEQMAREMLRPMLKAWLDENLPQMVERLVRGEIQRLTRGPR